MDMSLSFLPRQLATNPVLLITVLLALGVICVNGITDTSNAIATCVSIRLLDADLAVVMAVVCNCAGVVVMIMVNSTIAMTITSVVNFGKDTSTALVILCAALFPIAAQSFSAVSIGCPTNEGHTLVIGLTGAAVAIRRGFSAIDSAGWMKVVYGLIFSAVLGFLSGYLSCKLVAWTCRDMDRRKTTGFFRHAQIGRTATMALIHGAWDGQKLMGVMLLSICMVNGSSNIQGVQFLPWMLLLGSAVMALGTSIEGKKIIKSMGMDMVWLKKYQGFSADVAGAACPLGFPIFDIPVGITRTKTTAIMGMGAVKRLLAISLSVAKDMVTTWVMTFPGCGIIGFLIAKLFMVLFHG